ncbi:MAG: hypothetical protein J6M24_07025 [Lachnospiraceae bacterium]|nr:hypothetical protein [Lachnospiraceae bacterium]
MKKRRLLCLIIMNIVILNSCAKTSGKQYSSVFNINASGNTLEGFSVDKYLSGISKSLKEIDKCKNEYEIQIEKLKTEDSARIDFSSCEFKSIENINNIQLLSNSYIMPTEDETVAEFERLMKVYHLEDKIDIKDLLRDASCQVQEMSDLEWPYNYAAVYEHRGEFKDGGYGFFLTSPEFHLQYGSNGYYSFSDGIIDIYSQLGKPAHGAALGLLEEDVVESGTYEEMKNKSYMLKNGEVKICDVAENVKKRIMQGTPYPPFDGVTVDIPYVEVFRLRDIYGYNFSLRRIYNGIPFSYGDYGNRQFYSQNLYEDIKHVYTITGDTANAFVGYNEAEKLISLIEPSKYMLDLENAAELLTQKLAKELRVKVDTVEFVYLPVGISEDSPYRYICPCWGFFGKSLSDGKGIRMYIDALTGEIYYYTYRTSSAER